jgi:2-amino-4-hydroxy-6-hydroxymethyldihydropteridine diphosphokinase
MADIFISLGTNVQREQNLRSGLIALQQAFGALQLSSLFESDAVGFHGNAFYNLVIGASTDYSVQQVAELLRDIEYLHGRPEQAKKYSPRTLDLDLLLYEQLILTQPAQIPRDEITSNAFVLWPLAELAPQHMHPILQESYQQLWQRFDKSSQPIRKVPFTWPA